MDSTSSSRSLLFVYGTLKSGYTNYERYLQVAVAAGKAILLATGTSAEKYPLVLRPLTRLPATRGPMLLSTHNSDPADWSRIEGEVYEIDEDTRQAMDILEGVSSGYYYRENIIVDLHLCADNKTETEKTGTETKTHAEATPVITSAQQVVTECYFYTVQASDLDLVEAKPLLGVYDDCAHDEYVASPINQDILDLLHGPSLPT